MEPFYLCSSFGKFGIMYVSELLDACCSNPCLNDGTCEETDDGFCCACPVGFTGECCETGIFLSGLFTLNVGQLPFIFVIYTSVQVA